jgi:ABC-type uncharacterized transport system substrate-binding protein
VIGLLSSHHVARAVDPGYRRVPSRLDVAIEFRWAVGHYDRLPALAADLVGRHVTVLVTGGGTRTAITARAATSTIPIVFIAGCAVVESGLVAGLGRPARTSPAFLKALGITIPQSVLLRAAGVIQ